MILDELGDEFVNGLPSELAYYFTSIYLNFIFKKIEYLILIFN